MYRLSIFGGDTEEFGFDSIVLYPIFFNLYDVLLINLLSIHLELAHCHYNLEF